MSIAEIVTNAARFRAALSSGTVRCPVCDQPVTYEGEAFYDDWSGATEYDCHVSGECIDIADEEHQAHYIQLGGSGWAEERIEEILRDHSFYRNAFDACMRGEEFAL